MPCVLRDVSMPCCVLWSAEDTSAFSYISLHPHCTELVRIVRVEEDGEVSCRPVSAVHDAAELHQQLQNIYATGMNHKSPGARFLLEKLMKSLTYEKLRMSM